LTGGVWKEKDFHVNPEGMERGRKAHTKTKESEGTVQLWKNAIFFERKRAYQTFPLYENKQENLEEQM